MAEVINTVLALPEQYHSRLPIQDLHEKHPAQFSLFVRALELVKQSSEGVTNPYGWFQYAGIHGLPNVQWNNDPTPIINNTNDLFGYCSHASALFPLWHRIYVWQLERTITAAAQGIVQKGIADNVISQCANPTQCAITPCVPTCARVWTNAADSLRFPYWDWALHEGQMPPVLNEAEILIEIPGQGIVPIANPLVNYRFQQNESRPPPEDKYWFQEPYASIYPTTLRCPDINGVAHPELANEQLKSRHYFRRIGETANLTEYVYMLFSAIHEYIPFSNTAYADRAGAGTTIPGTINFASLEDVHNIVHVFVGAYAGFGQATPGGHMSLNEYAAYDPIFWLHHCNIDRLFAIWQQMNPEATFHTPYEGSGSGISKEGALESKETPLVPFVKPGTGGQYWTSELIQHWDSIYQLGYIYPETKPIPIATTPEGRREGRELSSDWIHKLYGPEAGKLVHGAPLHAPPAWRKAKAHTREWQVTSRIKRFEVEGSFHIHFFLGDVPSDPAEWIKPTEKNTYVGSNTVFSSRHGCSKCEKQKQDGKLVTGVVPLTRTLLDRPGDYDLEDEQEIEEYLKKELHWRVQKANGEEVPLHLVPSLQIAVTSTPVTLEQPFSSHGTANLPRWHHEGAKVHPVVTIHRAAGLASPADY
ncbi:hypothetical protein RUND412_008851 [Rhizina undulata]